jgi:hypothetical protein
MKFAKAVNAVKRDVQKIREQAFYLTHESGQSGAVSVSLAQNALPKVETEKLPVHAPSAFVVDAVTLPLGLKPLHGQLTQVITVECGEMPRRG